MQAVRDRPGSLRTAWLIWLVGAGAYLVAMLHRMSLGVAGSDAAARFDIPVGSLAIFTSLQLVVYLLLQVPAGLLADRFGPRRTLAIGLAFMAGGELLFAVAHSMPAGLTGRALVGVGDALTFLNVLRLVHAWFPHRMQALMAALTGFAGALGQLVSTVPLEASLNGLGWTGTFVALGGGTAVLVLLPLAAVRDRPARSPDAADPVHGPAAEGAHPQGVDAPAVASPVHEPILRTLRDAWLRPATRRGFFVHLGTLSPFMITGAVWGVPYMTGSQGMDRSTAAGFLLAASLAFVVCGPSIAFVVGPHLRRQRVASLLFPAATAVAWAVLMVWPGGTVPRGVLLAALVVTGAGAGASMIGFEIARRDSPAVSSGSTAALVNCGGFSAAVVGALVIGRLIGDGDRGAVATQHAMLPVLVFACIGFLGALLTGRGPLDAGSRVPTAAASRPARSATGD
jgi:MFS family permease